MTGKPQRWSLQRRLSLWIAGGVAGLWIASALAAGFIIRHEVYEVFDSALQEVAHRVLPLAYAELLNRDSNETQWIAPVDRNREYITYVVRDENGRDLMQSSDDETMPIPRMTRHGFATVGDLRLYTETAVSGTIVVTVAENLAHRRGAVVKAILTLAWPLAALVPFAASGVWMAVRWSLASVETFRAAVESRGQGNLNAIAADGLPNEIVPLATSVNALIGRMKSALDAERSFTANSAHELRTPIAAALAQTQRLVSELGEAPQGERARTIESALRRLARLSEKLMQLARAEGGSLVAEQPTPVGEILRFVVDEAEQQSGAQGKIALEMPASGGPALEIDPDAFGIMARNLIENAIRHGDPALPVRVSLRDDRLEVANGGAAIAPEVLERLTRPFERGATPAEGSGLGLAIVNAICRGAGFRLALQSPVAGQPEGFLATVHFSRT